MSIKKLACLGDSLTEGYNINLKVRWTNLLASKLNLEIINSGISGDTTAGMLARFHRDVILYKPSHMIIMGGTNDIWHGLSNEQIISNIMTMTRQAGYHDIKAIVGIPTPCLPLHGSESSEVFLDSKMLSTAINRYRNRLKQAVVEDNLPYIDFGEDMTSKHFLDDGVHINEAGQIVMAQNAINKLIAMD